MSRRYWYTRLHEVKAGDTVKISEGYAGGEVMTFTLETGEVYQLYHSQDCCENVTIEDINGNLDDLVGANIGLAEEAISYNKNPPGVPSQEYQDSFTWTFYKLATVKGYVTIRWYCEANGYYSKSVDWGRR